MVRMDRLLDAWRSDPRVDATVELCAMLIRAALKAGPNKLLADDFVLGFANEARTRHPSNLDVSIAITDLYLSTGLVNHALSVLDMTARTHPTDNRVKERLEKLGRRRRTQEFAARTPDPETLDAPTTPLDPPTERERLISSPPLTSSSGRRPTTIGLHAAPPPLPAPRRKSDSMPAREEVESDAPKDMRDDDTTRTDSNVPAAMRPPSFPPPARKDAPPVSPDPTAMNPRRQRTFLFGDVSPVVRPPLPSDPEEGRPTKVVPDPIPRTDDDPGPSTRTKVDDAPIRAARRAAVRRQTRFGLGPALEGPSEHDLPTKIGPIVPPELLDPGPSGRPVDPRAEEEPLSARDVSDDDSEHDAPTHARPLSPPLSPAAGSSLGVRPAPAPAGMLGSLPSFEGDPSTDASLVTGVLPDRFPPRALAPRPGSAKGAPAPAFLAEPSMSDESSAILVEDDEFVVTGLREPPPASSRAATSGAFATDSMLAQGDPAGPLVRGGTFSMSVAGQVPASFVPRPSGPAADQEAPRTYVLTAEESFAASRVDPRPPTGELPQHQLPPELGQQQLQAGGWADSGGYGSAAPAHGSAVVQRGMVVGAGSSAPPAMRVSSPPIGYGGPGSDAPVPFAPTFGPPPSGRVSATALAPFVPPAGNGAFVQSGAWAMQSSAIPYDPRAGSGALVAQHRRPIKLYAAIIVAAVLVASLVGYATYLLLADRRTTTEQDGG